MKRDESETVKGNAGKCGMFYTGLGGQTLNAIQKNIPSAQLMPMPPLLTPEGKYVYGIPYLYIGLWVVTRSLKTKDDVLRVLKFVDYGSSPEGADLMDYGVAGDYDTRPDGTKVLNDRGKADGAAALWLIPPPDKYLYVKQEQSTGHPELAEAQRKLVDSVEPVLLSDPILFTLPGPVELQKGGDLGRKRDEVFSKILAGQLSITAFDDWVAEWKKNGGDQIIEERSKSYAEIKK
jgi:putative aldouronate transport system substrate-binding protein